MASKSKKKVNASSRSTKNKSNTRKEAEKKLKKSIKIDLTSSNNNGKVGKIVEKFGWKKVVISAVALVLLIAGGIGAGVLIASQNKTEVADTTVDEEKPQPEEPEEPEVIENTDPLQPEPGLTDWSNYQVGPNKPRFMSIPSIGLNNIPVVEIGTSASNQLGAPENNQLIGWYYRSSLPGQPGVAMMDGHGGYLGDGILRNLPDIQNGAFIIIETGDGRKITYTVVEIIYKKLGTEADSYMKYAYQSPVEGAAALTIITCTGKWVPAEYTYDLRMFVKAVVQ